MPESASAIRAGRAFVELFTRDSALDRGLRRAQVKLRAFALSTQRIGLGVTAAGIALLAPLIGAVNQFTKTGDELNKMSARTGFAVRALSELGFAGEQTGQDLKTVELGIKGMQRSIRGLEQGLSTQKRAFNDLGLTIEDLQDLSPEEQFTLIADRLAKIEDPTRRAGVAMDVFGRAGTKLLPLLSLGAAGIEKLRQEARELGIVMSGEQAQAAADFADAWNRISRQLKFLIVLVGGELAPELSASQKFLSGLVRGVIDWTRENAALVKTVAAIGAGLIVVGGTLLAFSLAVTAASFIVGAFTTMLSVAGTVLGFFVSIPGLIVLGLAAATAAFFAFSDAGDRAARRWRGLFGQMKSDVGTAIGGIIDAIRAGDLELAMKILVTALKLIWKEFTLFLQNELIRALNAIFKDIPLVLFEGPLKPLFDLLDGFGLLPPRIKRLRQQLRDLVPNLIPEVKGDFKDLRDELDKLRREAGVKAALKQNPNPLNVAGAGGAAALALVVRKTQDANAAAREGLKATRFALSVNSSGLQGRFVLDNHRAANHRQNMRRIHLHRNVVLDEILQILRDFGVQWA